jgi:hypothetical protein
MIPSKRYGDMGARLQLLKSLEKEYSECDKLVRMASKLFPNNKKATKGKLSDRLEFILNKFINTIEALEPPRERIDRPVTIRTEQEKVEQAKLTEQLEQEWKSQKDDGFVATEEDLVAYLLKQKGKEH